MEEGGEEIQQKRRPSEEEEEQEEGPKSQPQQPQQQQGGGGGWRGWGISSLSVFSDLQKAAEEISRNAVEVAKNAAKGITEMQQPSSPAAAADPSESAAEHDASDLGGEETESDGDRLRRSALDRLEKAGEDSLLGQASPLLSSDSLNLIADWLESSAANLADTIQQGSLPAKASSLAPSIIETGKSFTAKGMEVLERVGKETMELLIEETGLEVEQSHDEVDQQAEEEQFEEVTFDRCFYIYGGPDQLEELEALSSHYALLFNRRKAKLLSEQKSFYDGKLKEIQQIFNLGTEYEESGQDSDKGKGIETADIDGDVEMKKLRDSSVSKAANMAAGFTSALGGLAANEIMQRTTDRLETLHSEGVHRLSELCCFAVSQLLTLGKSVISSANKVKSEESDGDNEKIDWPEDSVLKAKIIRFKAQSMSGDVERVSSSFMTGISDIIEAYLAAIQSASSDKQDGLPRQKSIQEKANAISYHLRADQTSALGKIQDALQYLAYVVLSTSMPSV
ncbi:hypothetical protein ACMD2_14701 [Ananas comosus]|uniref:DUF7798 domain-containing protein n=1 Tax=Ananas comosus TaxID=4615 RepID=A0A199UTW1_ANACO|nr:hypothetical protein ACMD2_14701 [Ananas comosus]